MTYISLTGKCPTQGKHYTITAKLFDRETKHAGRVQCDFVKYGGKFNQSPCAIIEQNGYHH